MLYAWGHTPEAMLAIFNEEFQDIEVNRLTDKVLKEIIRKNIDMFEQAKLGFAEKIDELSLVHMREVVKRVATSESTMVHKLANKLDEIVLVIAGIDLTNDLDDNGKPKKLATYLAMLEALERTVRLTEKYSGTGSLRDLNIYAEKARIDAQHKANPNDLIPDPMQDNNGARPVVYQPTANDGKKSLDV
jgi:hypothetical protein